MRWISFIPALMVLTIGCGEEAQDPPNLPTVESAKAQCRKVEGVYKLDLIEVTVRDLDGAEDLGTPLVFVESEELTLSAAPQAGGSEECGKDACDVLYTWEHDRDSEQIYCGEEGDLLIVDFVVEDREGFPAEAAIKTVPL